jgi:hypothetical protein
MRYVALIPAAILVVVCAIIMMGTPFSADTENTAANRDLRPEAFREATAPLLATPTAPLTAESTALFGPREISNDQDVAEPPMLQLEPQVAVEAVAASTPDRVPADEPGEDRPAIAKGGSTGPSRPYVSSECRTRQRPLSIRRIPVVNRRCR